RYNGAEVRQSWGTAFHGFGAALTASFALLFHWFFGRVRRLFDGIRGAVATADERDAPRNTPSSTGRDEPPRS
ncbi:MAG TPA: hypothetical protein VG963_31515, partial [Polyangiaceae bacterium]|nr:hypothetical protein [Polyangiaceae bacterium]